MYMSNFKSISQLVMILWFLRVINNERKFDFLLWVILECIVSKLLKNWENDNNELKSI